MTRRRSAEQTARTKALVEILLDLRAVCAKVEALLGLPQPTASAGRMVLFRVRPVWLGNPQDRSVVPLPAEGVDREARVRELLQEALRILDSA